MGISKPSGIVVAMASFWIGVQGPPARSLFLSAKSADALTFASLAVAKHIPTGFVGPATARDSRGRPAAEGTDSRDSDINAVTSAFNQAHAEYRAAVSASGILTIEDVRQPAIVDHLLSKAYPAFQVEGMQAFGAVVSAGNLIAKTPGNGIAGSISGTCTGLLEPVTIRLDHPTLRDVLNAIATQSLTGWLVFYDLDSPSDKLRIGMFCQSGEYVSFTVPGW